MFKKLLIACVPAMAMVIPASGVAAASPVQETAAPVAAQTAYYCSYQYAYVCDAFGRCVWAYQYVCG